MGEPQHVVGPKWEDEKWVFLCPVCDASALEPGDTPDAAQCTTDWLTGQRLVGDAKVDFREGDCFVTDPYDGVPEVTEAQKRFFYYRTVALLLGGAGRRVQLPSCIRERIEELHGKSGVGFRSA